jgi:hypothetical protein
MACCNKLKTIFCFFGFHKYEKTDALVKAKKIKKSKLYYEVDQCINCCKYKTTKRIYEGKTKTTREFSRLPSCSIKK